MAKKAKPANFEQSMSDLESIVTQMEKGDMSLEESLAAFEKGVELTRHCQTSLKDAEQRISILVEKASGDSVEPFESDKDTSTNAND
ncbi:MAG: exodeoxyribonuclease VII small subunit [Gammaproteobacteria bacterium]|nr:exodeoxyribonuclease VII small subunit [Gammaproteobacteria bacterium]